ncbi:MAG: hypothetical protein AAGG75_06590 [Bacteroidota bacterium]
MKKLFFYILGFGLLIAACEDSTSTTDLPGPETPFNPFDTVNYDETMVPTTPVDSNTFLGLHTYIFSTSCNLPACHDGTFEPDFRTIQSAYNTLVYHPVKKNFPVDSVPFRVTPGDPALSMIYRRLTEHNPPNFERMPSSGIPLPEENIALIKNWIEAGAPDIYGNLPELSSTQPVCYGLLAYNEAGERIDTIRGSFLYNPFRVSPSDGKITLWFLFADQTPEGETVFGNELTYNKLRVSADVTFRSSDEFSMQIPFIPQLVNSAFSQPIAQVVPYYQNVTIDPFALGYGVGDIVYLRTYVQDSDHDEPTEIPENDTQFAIQTYFAFSIQ